MFRQLVQLLATTLIVVFCADQTLARAEDVGSLDGVWKVVEMEVDGKTVPPEEFQNNTVTFKKNEFAAKNGEDVLLKGTIKLAAKAKHSELTLLLSEGEDKGKEYLGILETKNNTLRICLSSPGLERPTEFRTYKHKGEEQRRALISLERKK